MPRPIQATISLAALRHNLEVARRRAPGSSVFAVVKANAYGHGARRTARAMAAAQGLALLEIETAVALREDGDTRRILLLGGAFNPADYETAARHGLSVVVHGEDQLRMLEAARPAAPLDVVVKLNTGMNRLGFDAAAVPAALSRLRADPRVSGLTLMTHFADADDMRGVDWQLAAFERIAQAYPELPRTLANSAAILRYPQTHAGWVRPGIMLYGCSPFPEITAEALDLRPVMTLTTELVAVRDLAAGDRIGYGGTFEAPHAMRVGVVACGYADGYPRHAPTDTPILVGGRRTRTLGRVSMDLLHADLEALPEARPGTPVTLWGDGLSADEVAVRSGTVSYELLCALAARVPVRETG